MFKRIWVFLTLLTFTAPVFAIGMTIATALVTAGYLSATYVAVTAFAINMVVSAAISYAITAITQPNQGGGGGADSAPPDTGNRVQTSPATDNKLPVIYGTAWTGGIITDLTITENNQTLYYVISLCEVTGTNGTADTITFGDIYYGGKKVTFQGNGHTVASLTDESTGVVDTAVAGKIDIYLYNNGSNSPTNSSTSAITLLQDSGLTYKWDSTKLMTNCAFAVLKLTYSVTANVRGINQTRFQVTNSRTKPGDCFLDYLQNARYGAALPVAQIDTTSLTALNTYCDGSFAYTDSNGNPQTQSRFRFDGVIDTGRNVLANLQDMSSSCDCIVKYNEITAKWGVIIQQPTYTVAMYVTDSDIISGITISPLDISSSFNYIEAKFPDKTNQDAFNTVNFDLAEIDPTLLFPNEPVNKFSASLPLVNNSVRAQYIATRLLKAGREDLQVQFDVYFKGLQLEAGDVVSITNTNYGWSAKLFRTNKVVQTFNDDGSIVVKLNLTEFNPAIWDDTSITEFTPAPNTGIGDPTFFGNVPAPLIYGQYPTATNPYFTVLPYASDSGIIQYAEVWYSAYASPTESQRYFAGTTTINSGGTPYEPGTQLPLVTLSNIPAGNWYIFTRMVNSLASSAYSPASTLFHWEPTTVQFSYRYLCIAYGTSSSGAGFSLDPRGKTHYGIYNSDSSTPPTEPSLYQWYDASPDFGTIVYFLYCNRTGRKFSFSTGFAAQAAGTGTWVPTSTLNFDPSIWSALPDGTNAIDLDVRTGQLIQTGTTTVGTGEIAITNNLQGQVVAALQQYLNFGGAYSQTFAAGNLTVDIYGRVVGFESPDAFYYSEQEFTATAGQTVFSVTRGSGYIPGQCLVYQNGLLLNTSEYTDAASTVTFATGRTVGSRITIESFKSVSSISLTTLSTSGTGSVATITFSARPTVPFTVGQSITVSGVTPTGYNGTFTVTACTNNTVSYASTATGSQTVAGTITLANLNYASFSRNSATLTNQGTYTASGFTLYSGYELLFLNGTIMNSQDYDISGQDISFIGNATGDLQIIQWSPNNLGVPNGTPVNVDAVTVAGQYLYSFNFDANAFNVFENGVQLIQGTDFTTGTNTYTLVPTPVYSNNILVQQTFARTGAV